MREHEGYFVASDASTIADLLAANRRHLDEIDRLQAELAEQRARAEAAERERDVARRLAQQEYHHRMKAEQAASPPPADAGAAMGEAEMPPLPEGKGDARFQLGFEHGYARIGHSYPDDSDYERGHRTGALFRSEVCHLAPLIHREKGGQFWVGFHYIGWMEEDKYNASPPPADAGDWARRDPITKITRMDADRMPPADADPSTLAAELREWAGAMEDGDYSPEYIGLLRWAADAIERLEAVARAARPAAPAAIVLWHPESMTKRHLEMFEADTDARRFARETGGDHYVIDRTTWHPAPAAPAGPAAPAADPDAPEPWTPGVGERVRHRTRREIGIVESGPHPGVFDPGPYIDVRVGVFRTTWDVANIEPAPAAPAGPEEGAVTLA
jgi:hypothetical protein